MRKLVLILIFFVVFLLPIPTAGQTQVTFDSLQVDIRPEYDRPSVLVMYDIVLPQSALGTPVSLRIPAAAGAPFALAYGPGDGSLFDLQYERQVSGEWATIKFTSTMAYVRLEYYEPAIKVDGESRIFSYIWPADYAVNSMLVLIMQPWGASQMQISPGQWTSQVNTDGLSLFGSEIGQVSAGAEIEINISYAKSGDDLTSEHLVPQPSGTISDTSANNLQWQEYIPWVLGILGAAMLGGGLFWYWKTGRQEQTTARRRPRPSKQVTDSSPAADGSSGGYCHQCGNRTAATDRFCRVCGARLRTE